MSAPARPALLRNLRSLAALVGSALALTFVPGTAALASVPVPPSAQVSTATDDSEDSPLTATLAADRAGVLAPGETLTASITVSNSSDLSYGAGTAVLWVDPAAQKSRSTLDTWLASTDAVDKAVTIGTAPVPILEPGGSTVVTVIVPAASVPFAADPSQAVFGIGASVTAGATTTNARSSIVWSPGATATPTTVGVVMPIVSPSSADGLISADDLATYTAPNGVLTRELDGLVRHSTVAIGLDPMIVASIRALGNAAPASASDWLRRLSLLPNDTFSLGFGDADLVGQFQSGLTKPLTPVSLDYALDPKNFTPSPTPVGEPPDTHPTQTESPTPSPTPTAGNTPVLPTLDELVSWDFSLQGIAWPGDGTVRAADLPALKAAGFSTALISGGNTNAASINGTSNAVLPFDGGKLGVADAALSAAIRQASSAASDAAWNAAMSKVNAQLELASQEGGQAKHVLIAFDRSWPSSGTQLQRTLDSLLNTPWSTPATLPDTLAAPSTSGLALVDAPESQARVSAIRSLTDDEGRLDQFATILDDPTTMTGAARAELLTLLAVSWQNPRNDWAAAVAKSRSTTTKTLDSVKIVPTENVNLVSAQGSIPFTVVNDLKDQAANVVLRADPSNSRLEIDQDTTKRIPADSRATMLVPVKAKLGNGQVTLTLTLYSPTGVQIGDQSSAKVDVHADWEGIGALIFGILLVLLFGFGIVRNILRRRDQRKEDDGDETPEAETTEDAERG
jgi:hypothetical protein